MDNNEDTKLINDLIIDGFTLDQCNEIIMQTKQIVNDYIVKNAITGELSPDQVKEVEQEAEHIITEAIKFINDFHNDSLSPDGEITTQQFGEIMKKSKEIIDKRKSL